MYLFDLSMLVFFLIFDFLWFFACSIRKHENFNYFVELLDVPPCGKRAFSPDAFAIMIVAHRKGLPTLAWWTCHHEKKRVFSPRGEHLVSRAPASFLSRVGLQDPRHRGLLTEVAPRLLTILQHWPDIPPVDKSTPIVRLVAFTDVSAQLGGSWLQVFVAAGWVLVVIGCTETQQSISPRGCWGASAASFGCSIAWCLVPVGICS